MSVQRLITEARDATPPDPGPELEARPGKRTLSESIEGGASPPVQRAASAASGVQLSTAARPTLDMLFGRGPVQRAQRATAEPAGDRAIHAAAARGVATPVSALPHAAAIQRSFGRHDVPSIQAHVGGEAASSAREMGARGYATGDHVVFDGTPDLHTAAHEAAHVIQQRGGVQLKGGVGRDGDAHERHADAVADRVVRGESSEALLDSYAGGSASPRATGPVQQTKRWVKHIEKWELIEVPDSEPVPPGHKVIYVAELADHVYVPEDQLASFPYRPATPPVKAEDAPSAHHDAPRQLGEPPNARSEKPEPRTARPEQTELHAARSDMGRSDVGKSDVGKSDVGRSDVAKSDVGRSDVARSDVGKSDVSTTVPSAQDRDVTVYIRSDIASEVHFTLSVHHLANTSLFYDDVRTKFLAKEPALARVPRECLVIKYAGKEIPAADRWPSWAPHIKDTSFQLVLDSKRKPALPDMELVGLVEQLSPTLVVPCSQIDDTHVHDPDADVRSQQPLRVLSLENLKRQQHLDKVLTALQQRTGYSLVLIDPSFGPGGDQVYMIQIVEYLASQGYHFTPTTGPKSSTIYTCGNVMITYIGVALNTATKQLLPNLGSI